MKKNIKIVAIVPIKKNSKRVKGKNFKKINKKPLYTYLLDKLKLCNFDEIFIDSDSKEVENYFLPLSIITPIAPLVAKSDPETPSASNLIIAPISLACGP